MTKNLDVKGTDSLDDLFKTYSQVEKRFWEILWGTIQAYVPDNFDKKVLNLKDILSSIQWSGIVWEEKAHIKLSKYNYQWILVDLFTAIKWLDGVRQDGFEYQIRFKEENLENPTQEQLIISIVKIPKEKKVLKDDATVTWVEKILEWK